MRAVLIQCLSEDYARKARQVFGSSEMEGLSTMTDISFKSKVDSKSKHERSGGSYTIQLNLLGHS